MYLYVSVFILFLLLPTGRAFCDDSAHLMLGPGIDCHHLAPAVQFLKDEHKKYSINDIAAGHYEGGFFRVPDMAADFGSTDAAYWMKLEIASAVNAYHTWFLELENPGIDSFILYYPGRDGRYREYRTGADLPFYQRYFKHRNFIFRINICCWESRAIYARFESSDRLYLPLKLWSSGAFYAKDHDEQFFSGIFTGIYILLGLAFLAFALTYRSSKFFYLFIFILIFTAEKYRANGFLSEYFTPEFIDGFVVRAPLPELLIVFSFVLFIMKYAEIGKLSAVAEKIIYAFLTMTAVLFVVSFRLKPDLNMLLSYAVYVCAAFTVLYCIIKLSALRGPSFYFLLVSVLLFSFGILVKIFPASENFFMYNFLSAYFSDITAAAAFACAAYGTGLQLNISQAKPPEIFSIAEHESAGRVSLICGNSIENAVECARITADLLSHLEGAETVGKVKNAVLSLIINSIIHGNLGEPYRSSGKYSIEESAEIIKRRSGRAGNGRNKVYIEAWIESGSYSLSVRDSGEGFDYAEAFKTLKGDAGIPGIPADHPIILAKKFFNSVKVSRTGNSFSLSRTVSGTPRVYSPGAQSNQ